MARRATGEQREVTRAKIILGAAEGERNEAIGRRLGIHRQQAQRWRDRWAESGEALAAAEANEEPKALAETIRAVLADKHRSGGPAKFTPEQMCAIMAVACEPPEESGRPVTHWTPAELADEAMKRKIVTSISPRHVGRFLNRGRTAAPS
jgi:transposase